MDLSTTKILVTGAAGFIGSSLVESLISKNCDVIGFDNFNPYYQGKEKNILSFKSHQNFTMITGDILDLELLQNTMKETKIVFHLAAQPGVRYSLEHPTITNKINTEGTLNVLLAAKNSKVKKIVNASSSSVYGNPEYTPVDEAHPLNPISMYGISKLAAEKYCSIFSKTFDLKITSLRYHTVYGPKGRPDMAVFKWIDALFRNQPIRLFGDGTQQRDMTYIDDIVSGTIKAAESDQSDGEIFNLAAGRVVSMNYVISQLHQITGHEPNIIFEEKKAGDVDMTSGNIDKAKEKLNYEPKILIEKGLQKTVDWYKKTFSVPT